jgi:DNA-binding response OmpR family regulator
MPLRVAVVNDDAAYLQLLQELLSDEGYEVAVFHTVEVAYQEIRNYQPHLLIVDLLFPESKQGVDLISMLWLHADTRAIPIIVASAATTQLKSMEDMLRAKGITVLYKPFDLEDLLLAIRRMTVAHRP